MKTSHTHKKKTLLLYGCKIFLPMRTLILFNINLIYEVFVFLLYSNCWQTLRNFMHLECCVLNFRVLMASYSQLKHRTGHDMLAANVNTGIPEWFCPLTVPITFYPNKMNISSKMLAEKKGRKATFLCAILLCAKSQKKEKKKKKTELLYITDRPCRVCIFYHSQD